MSSTPTQPKRRYRTTNWKQYNAALKARGSLTVWFDKNMAWFAAASGKRGRSPKFSDAAIQFCLTLKNLFGLALRQATGLVQSLLSLSGLHWPVPDYSTLCRRQLGLEVQVPYHRRSLVETKMHCMKRLGERVMSHIFALQGHVTWQIYASFATQIIFRTAQDAEARQHAPQAVARTRRSRITGRNVEWRLPSTR